MSALVTTLKAHEAAIADLMDKLAIEDLRGKIDGLEEQAGEAEFWNNAEAAQKTMQEISRLKGRISPWVTLYGRIRDTLELAQLGDASLAEELEKEAAEIEVLVARMSVQAMLSGQNDGKDAFLAIHSGAGGTESQDWAQMLERMYLRWAEDNGYKVEMIDRSEGEEAGVKSVTMCIRGEYAYGYLRSEQGVHRLVRISPFDAQSRRHTSFAKVELWPDVQDATGEIEIAEKDIRMEVYRASGAGGQHVQKNSTAVRLIHIPTGLVIQCQNERSQAQNRDKAMQILKARLLDMERQKKEAELAALKGENMDANFGSQIRSYVLHPYQLVKDLRTDHETGNTTAVLDGRLNDFMEAYLQMKVAEGGA
ncbi:MAG: peptide chain release factor 2 [Anaerolineae bacterium]|jgi:peptide chain release factor 2|nr:peptide chain release factor 2 [Anaerolineae bacterium]